MHATKEYFTGAQFGSPLFSATQSFIQNDIMFRTKAHPTLTTVCFQSGNVYIEKPDLAERRHVIPEVETESAQGTRKQFVATGCRLKRAGM